MNLKRVRRKAIKMLGFPIAISIEPIAACNINCPFCTLPSKETDRFGKRLTLEQFKKIIDSTLTLPFKLSYTLHGAGESFLNPDFLKMVEYTNSLGLETYLSTNGTLLNKETAKKFLDNPTTILRFCLDGGTKESYEKIRKGATFEKVVENLRFICEEKHRRKQDKPFIEVSMIITKFNEHEIETVREMTKRFGVDKFLTKRMNLTLNSVVDDNLKKEFIPNNAGLTPFRIVNGEVKHMKRRRLCEAVFKPLISCEGDVTICCADGNYYYKVGNVFENSFNEIWKSERYREVRRRARKRGLGICQTCGIN